MRLPIPTLLRLLEAASGILATLGGGATLAFLLFVPVYRGTGCVTLPGQPVVCQPLYNTLLNGTDPATSVELALVAALLLAVGAAAVWHVRTGQGGAQAVLCVSTGVLALWTLCTWLVPGAPLLPSVALALAACAASAGRGSAVTAADPR